jgi:hypothetical protein
VRASHDDGDRDRDNDGDDDDNDDNDGDGLNGNDVQDSPSPPLLCSVDCPEHCVHGV